MSRSAWVFSFLIVSESTQSPQVTILTVIYVCCVVSGALLVFLGLDEVDLSEVGHAGDTNSPWALLTSPLRQFALPRQWYILPLTLFSGLEGSFFVGEYTKAYVACNGGVHLIGLHMICVGLVSSLASSAFGHLVSFLDRAWLFGAAGVLHAALLALLWLWTPDYPAWVLYVVSALWGLAGAVWQTQLRVLYEVLFPDARGAAFSVHGSVSSLGQLVGFSISSRICLTPKLVLLAVFLLVGLTGYAATEVSHRKTRVSRIKKGRT